MGGFTWQDLFSEDNKLIIQKLIGVVEGIGEHIVVLGENKEELQGIKTELQQIKSVLQDMLTELQSA